MFSMKAKLLRDLRGEEATTPCAVGPPELPEAPGPRAALVRMRKLRAGVNMLTARLGNAAEEGGDCYERELRRVGEWVRVLKASADEAAFQVRPGEDEELDKLRETVHSGIRICQRALQREDGERVYFFWQL